jgi:flagellar biosynthetic protein FliR
MLGILLMWQTLPDVLDQFTGILTDAYDLISKLLRL